MCCSGPILWMKSFRSADCPRTQRICRYLIGSSLSGRATAPKRGTQISPTIPSISLSLSREQRSMPISGLTLFCRGPVRFIPSASISTLSDHFTSSFNTSNRGGFFGRVPWRNASVTSGAVTSQKQELPNNPLGDNCGRSLHLFRTNLSRLLKPQK